MWIEGDSARLQQVVNNLLSNANKYTPEGGSVHVAVHVERDQAVISVRDNGVGIEADLLPRVFDLFEQGTRALDREQGGLGVGLTLVQRLVRLHQGHVEAESAGPGKGADFRVYLPCLPSPAPMPAAREQPGTRRRAVAAPRADCRRQPRCRRNHGRHAHVWPATRCAAHEATQALALAQEFAPEIVLLDIGLPRVDGYQVARRLRELPQTRHTLLVGLSGYGMPADRQRGREARLRPPPAQARRSDRTVRVDRGLAAAECRGLAGWPMRSQRSSHRAIR